ncbi:MAG: hypothetical protein AWU59_239 [Methanolobus sp. T82-4]|jgi:predicted transcriptional regulator|nr:MAG: hypothetical protein AWU59_239 [Methanolobus sp. T82-4]
MVVGYRFFLKRLATMMDSKETLSVTTIADRLNLRQDEFRDLLNIMERKGDIECTVEDANGCGGGCKSCPKACRTPAQLTRDRNMKSYRLTEKGRSLCK